jgi:hypothetical protein
VHKVYHWIAENPGSAIVWFLAVVLFFAVMPWFVWGPTYYAGTDWPRTVAMFATLVLAVAGGMIPIARWLDAQVERQEELVQQIIARKPLVVTNLGPNGQYEIRNIGNAIAINVWLLPESGEGVALGLGSLDVHEARTIGGSVLRQPHTLIAQARPSEFVAEGLRRPFTVTFNVMAGDSGVRHGLDRNPPDERLSRGGTINDYLAAERIALVKGLREFTADAPAAWFGETDRVTLDAVPTEAAEIGLGSDKIQPGSPFSVESFDTFRLKGQ